MHPQTYQKIGKYSTEKHWMTYRNTDRGSIWTMKKQQDQTLQQSISEKEITHKKEDIHCQRTNRVILTDDHTSIYNINYDKDNCKTRSQKRTTN